MNKLSKPPKLALNNRTSLPALFLFLLFFLSPLFGGAYVVQLQAKYIYFVSSMGHNVLRSIKISPKMFQPRKITRNNNL